jgi:hypothetical protein
MSLQYLLKCCGQQKHHHLLDKKLRASETGKHKRHDLPCSGHPVTAVSPEMLQRADAIVCKDQRIITDNWHSDF